MQALNSLHSKKKSSRRFCPAARIMFVLFILSLIGSPGCKGGPGGEPDSITVLCGAANKPAMEEISAMFERDRNIEVNLIFGGSGTLLSQIELSKKGEIYLPGSPDYIIIAEKKNLIVKGSDRLVAYLVPAVITPAGNPAGIESLEDLSANGVRVAIGNPETVCLGLYGVELLEKNGLIESVMKNVVTFGGSCSKLANLAAMDQVDAILGWRVFHFWNPERMAYVPIAPGKIPRLSYVPIAIPVYTRDMDLSRSFIDYVLSPKGKEVYRKLGYITDLGKAKSFAPGAGIGGVYTLPGAYFNAIKKIGNER